MNHSGQGAGVGGVSGLQTEEGHGEGKGAGRAESEQGTDQGVVNKIMDGQRQKDGPDNDEDAGPQDQHLAPLQLGSPNGNQEGSWEREQLEETGDDAGTAVTHSRTFGHGREPGYDSVKDKRGGAKVDQHGPGTGIFPHIGPFGSCLPISVVKT